MAPKLLGAISIKRYGFGLASRFPLSFSNASSIRETKQARCRAENREIRVGSRGELGRHARGKARRRRCARFSRAKVAANRG